MNKKILIMTIVFLAIDQASKIIIDSVLKLNETIRVISGFFYLTNDILKYCKHFCSSLVTKIYE